MYALQLTNFTNPRMQLFHIPQCSIQNRNVHISVLNGALWDMEQVHSGICELCQLPDVSEVTLNDKDKTDQFQLERIRCIDIGCDVKLFSHWGRMTHICVGIITIIGSNNGLSHGRRQAITWTNAGLLSIGLLGTNFSEISIRILSFSFKKIHMKMSSAKMTAILFRGEMR